MFKKTVVLMILAMSLVGCNKNEEVLEDVTVEVEAGDSSIDKEPMSQELEASLELEVKEILYDKFELDFENLFNSLGKSTENSNLIEQLGGSVFRNKMRLINMTTLNSFNNTLSEYYNDLEGSDGRAVLLYTGFDLLPYEVVSDSFHGGEGLSRAEAMAVVAKSMTTIDGEEPHNEGFSEVVGGGNYAGYASIVDNNAYLNSSNGLNTQLFNTYMTLGEYCYLVYNTFLSECYIPGLIPDIEDVEIPFKNAGAIDLGTATSNPDYGMPSQMYDAYFTFYANYFVSDEDKWNEPVTKTKAVDILISISNAYYMSAGDNVYVEEQTNNRTVDELKDYINTSSNEGLTADEIRYVDTMYIDLYRYGEHTKNMDGQYNINVEVAWVIYFADCELNTEGISYAINVRTGEKLYAGPDTYLYEGSPFYGSFDYYREGDEKCEYITNLMQ